MKFSGFTSDVFEHAESKSDIGFSRQHQKLSIIQNKVFFPGLWDFFRTRRMEMNSTGQNTLIRLHTNKGTFLEIKVKK